MSEVAVLEDRICDLDGDGVADNAVADLGQPSSALMAAGLSALVQGTLSGSPAIGLLHLPWVDDRRGPNDPEARLSLLRGLDTDDPPDPEDDRSGSEPFFAHPMLLDGCGEPLFELQGGSIEEGAASTERSSPTAGPPTSEFAGPCSLASSASSSSGASEISRSSSSC
jgi:hypothetical protein